MLSLLIDRLEPDVTEADLAAVVLQPQRPGFTELLVEGVARHLVELTVVDDRDAVVDDRQPALLADLALGVHPQAAEANVVGLPVFRRPADVLARGDDAV